MRFLFCCALFLKLAFEDQVFHIEVLIEENDVGFLARSDAAVGIVDADGLCGIHSGTFDCASQRNAHFLDCGTHAVHEVGGASGDGAVSQGSQVSDYFYRLSTQRIASVGKTGCHHAVADEADAVVTEHLKGGAYGSRVEMNAVTDQLDADMVTVAGCADNAGSSVREGRHRVVEMGGMTSAAVVSFPLAIS